MEGALPLDVPLTVDVKVGTDWESMTPMTRLDAILAEADEAPLEGPARLSRRSVSGIEPAPITAETLRARAEWQATFPGSRMLWSSRRR